MQMCNKCGKLICGEQSGSSRGKLITIGDYRDYNSFYFDLCEDCTEELKKFFGMEKINNKELKK